MYGVQNGTADAVELVNNHPGNQSALDVLHQHLKLGPIRILAAVTLVLIFLATPASPEIVKFQGREIPLENLTPILSPEQEAAKRRELEQRLYEVFLILPAASTPQFIFAKLNLTFDRNTILFVNGLSCINRVNSVVQVAYGAYQLQDADRDCQFPGPGNPSGKPHAHPHPSGSFT